MDVDAWVTSASDDARRRGLEGLPPLLDTLARSTRALRKADEVQRAQTEGAAPPQPEPPTPSAS